MRTPRTQANVDRILDDLLARLPAGRIVTVTMPDYTVTPAGADYGDPRQRHDGDRGRQRTMARLAAERGIACVDIFDLSQRAAEDRTLVAGDGLHPSGAQYAALGRADRARREAIVRRPCAWVRRCRSALAELNRAK